MLLTSSVGSEEEGEIPTFVFCFFISSHPRNIKKNVYIYV